MFAYGWAMPGHNKKIVLLLVLSCQWHQFCSPVCCCQAIAGVALESLLFWLCALYNAMLHAWTGRAWLCWLMDRVVCF
jgi:hypothetical protein